MKNKAAVYARYSCDNQKETSLEDQIRRCRELAEQHGLVIDDSLIFEDAALSGTAVHEDRRDGYKALHAAWDAGKFDFVLVDDSSRLDRDGVEHALLIRKLENNLRVKLITGNGTDTRILNWQLPFSMQGVMGQQAIRDIKHLVVRGMVGQLDRGFMIATPAFGYALDRELDSRGSRIGTHWKIDEAAAEIVRNIFRKRGEGQSMHQIARSLNEQGVPMQRKSKRADGGYWRASRVNNILKNPIYRGEFMWNNSTTIRARAKKSGRELKVKSFARPQLRLVSDELWYRFNDKIISRTGYGGGKHPFAGLVTCGDCGSVLVLSSQSRCRSLYCANCTTAKAMGVQPARQTSTVAAAGFQFLLRSALRSFLTPGFIEMFRAKLHQQMTGDQRHELERLEQELTQQKRSQERLSRLLASAEHDDPVLKARYDESRDKARALSNRLDTLRAHSGLIDRDAINAQMRIDPLALLSGMLDADVAPEKMRALIARLFPEVIFEGKPLGRYSSVFSIRFSMGEALALASGTESMLADAAVRRYQLTYHPIARGRRIPEWTVRELPDEESSDDVLGADVHHPAPPAQAEQPVCLA